MLEMLPVRKPAEEPESACQAFNTGRRRVRRGKLNRLSFLFDRLKQERKARLIPCKNHGETQSRLPGCNHLQCQLFGLDRFTAKPLKQLAGELLRGIGHLDNTCI